MSSNRCVALGGPIGEGKSRPRESDENENDARYYDAYYVPIERIEKFNEFFAKLEASKYQFMALFGEEAATPFHEIKGVRDEIIRAAGILIRRPKDQERIEELEQIIRWTGSNDDPLDKRLEAAIESIKGICRPILLERPYLASQHLHSWLRDRLESPTS